MMKKLVLGAWLALALAGQSAFAAEASTSLLSNGDFETDRKGKGWPDDWPQLKETTWEVEKGNHFLRLKAVEPGKLVLVYRAVPLKPEHQRLELSFRARHTEVKRGKESWFDARVMLDFKDAAGKKLKSDAKAPYFSGTSKDWKEVKVQFTVPEGAKQLEVMPALFQVQSGVFDLDDFRLVAVAAATGATASPPAPIQVLGKGAAPEELRVVGNQLQTARGRVVWLQGVNVPSLEWSTRGDNVLRSIVVAIEDWKANVIRLPVHEERWFGRGGDQKDGGQSYRELVDQAIEAAESRTAYLILDLHHYRAPNEASVAFWRSAAERYQNRPGVLFGLLNEPHGIPWEVWRNGGQVQEKAKSDAPAENAEKLTSFESPGMQKLVDVIRETGAQNVLVAGGLDWAYDLSGVLKGFALTDKGGRGIVYDTHVYPWKSGWQDKFLAVAEKHPVLLGEVGCDIKPMPFIPPAQQRDPYTWAPDVLACIQQHKLHWTAWCFHPSATPRIIQDWDYTPTPFWGAFVRSALRGGNFQLNKLR
ncbi:MAG: cellulase family glycosylhydrolase [Verrucomicrobiota bacterium]